MSKRCTASDLKYGFDEKTIISLKKADPTGTQCIYIDWIYRQYKTGQFLPEDVLRVKDDLELYHTNKVRLEGKDKDINTLTYSSLKVLLRDKFVKLNIQEDNITGDDIVVIYEGPYGKLYNPLTKEASCKLGSGTKWCTAASNNNMFDDYNSKGSLYIWIDSNWNKGIMKELNKSKSKKFQFHFQTRQYMDELDNKISSELLEYYRLEHPIVSQLFTRYEQSIKDDNIVLYEYILDTDAEDLLDKYIVGNRDREYEFLSALFWADVHIEKHIGLEEMIERYETYMEDYGNTMNIVKYVCSIRFMDRDLVNKHILGHLDREAECAIQYRSTWYELSHGEDWPEVEARGDLDEQILLDRRYSLRYIMELNVNRRTIDPTGIDDIIVRAVVLWEQGIDIQELYKESPEAAIYYAIYVIRSRCKYIEVNGMSGNTYLNNVYRILFIHGKDIPTNAYEVTVKDIDAIYGNEEFYFGPDKPCNPGDNPYGHRNLLDTYNAYMDKYPRSEVIERYLVKYCKDQGELLTYMAINVFGTRLSTALGYIDPNIENNMNARYRYVFMDFDYPPDHELGYRLDYIKIHGSTPYLLDYIAKYFNKLETMYMETTEIDRLGNILTYTDLEYVFSKLSKNSPGKFLIYPLLFDVRSDVIESIPIREGSYYQLCLYQYYWLKFLKYKMPILEGPSIYPIYLDNYKDKIEYYEVEYMQSVQYLKTRVN